MIPICSGYELMVQCNYNRLVSNVGNCWLSMSESLVNRLCVKLSPLCASDLYLQARIVTPQSFAMGQKIVHRINEMLNESDTVWA